MQTPKITPFLWFNDNLEEAIDFYLSIFKNGKVHSMSRYGDAGPGPKGTVMAATFELEGQVLSGLNGGPVYQLSPAFSLFVSCCDQAEVDHYWDALVAGGRPDQCGWLQDKFGLSWQIVPTRLPEMLSDKDAGRAMRTMQAMLQMKKLDVGKLEAAYNG